jgi:hypothetical protein
LRHPSRSTQLKELSNMLGKKILWIKGDLLHGRKQKNIWNTKRNTKIFKR